ncbi:hypothetical protein PTKIN_Ptkin16aG0043900 [Pterospermum kingtungense]
MMMMRGCRTSFVSSSSSSGFGVLQRLQLGTSKSSISLPIFSFSSDFSTAHSKYYVFKHIDDAPWLCSIACFIPIHALLLLNLGKMLKLGLQPTLITFSTLINGLCIQGKVAQAMRLLEDMVEEGYQPNLIIYGTVLNGLCKLGDTTRAISLLRIMGERGCAPDIITYSTLIDGLCKDNHAAEAL